MADKQGNTTEPEHSGIEMTSPEQPTKQVGSFPKREDKPSTSSSRPSREQIGHRVGRYTPPIRDAMHGIDIRSGINRSPTASASGQNITQLPQPSRGIGIRSGIHRYPAASVSGQSITQLPQPSHGIDLRSGISRSPAASVSGQSITQLPQPSHGIDIRSGINRSPEASASGQRITQLPEPSHGNDIRSGINRSPVASSSGQSDTQEPEPARKGLNLDDIELTSAEIYYLLRLERKNISKILNSKKMSDGDNETVCRQRKLNPEDYRTPPELDTDDQNEGCCGTLSLILIMCFLNLVFFGLFILVGLYTYYKISD